MPAQLSKEDISAKKLIQQKRYQDNQKILAEENLILLPSDIDTDRSGIPENDQKLKQRAKRTIKRKVRDMTIPLKNFAGFDKTIVDINSFFTTSPKVNNMKDLIDVRKRILDALRSISKKKETTLTSKQDIIDQLNSANSENNQSMMLRPDIKVDTGVNYNHNDVNVVKNIENIGNISPENRVYNLSNFNTLTNEDFVKLPEKLRNIPPQLLNNQSLLDQYEIEYTNLLQEIELRIEKLGKIVGKEESDNKECFITGESMPVSESTLILPAEIPKNVPKAKDDMKDYVEGDEKDDIKDKKKKQDQSDKISQDKQSGGAALPNNSPLHINILDEDEIRMIGLFKKEFPHFIQYISRCHTSHTLPLDIVYKSTICKLRYFIQNNIQDNAKNNNFNTTTTPNTTLVNDIKSIDDIFATNIFLSHDYVNISLKKPLSTHFSAYIYYISVCYHSSRSFYQNCVQYDTSLPYYSLLNNGPFQHLPSMGNTTNSNYDANKDINNDINNYILPTVDTIYPTFAGFIRTLAWIDTKHNLEPYSVYLEQLRHNSTCSNNGNNHSNNHDSLYNIFVSYQYIFPWIESHPLYSSIDSYILKLSHLSIQCLHFVLQTLTIEFYETIYDIYFTKYKKQMQLLSSKTKIETNMGIDMNKMNNKEDISKNTHEETHSITSPQNSELDQDEHNYREVFGVKFDNAINLDLDPKSCKLQFSPWLGHQNEINFNEAHSKIHNKADLQQKTDETNTPVIITSCFSNIISNEMKESSNIFISNWSFGFPIQSGKDKEHQQLCDEQEPKQNDEQGNERDDDKIKMKNENKTHTLTLEKAKELLFEYYQDVRNALDELSSYIDVSFPESKLRIYGSFVTSLYRPNLTQADNDTWFLDNLPDIDISLETCLDVTKLIPTKIPQFITKIRTLFLQNVYAEKQKLQQQQLAELDNNIPIEYQPTISSILSQRIGNDVRLLSKKDIIDINQEHDPLTMYLFPQAAKKALIGEKMDRHSNPSNLSPSSYELKRSKDEYVEHSSHNSHNSFDFDTYSNLLRCISTILSDKYISDQIYHVNYSPAIRQTLLQSLYRLLENPLKTVISQYFAPIESRFSKLSHAIVDGSYQNVINSKNEEVGEPKEMEGREGSMRTTSTANLTADLTTTGVIDTDIDVEMKASTKNYSSIVPASTSTSITTTVIPTNMKAVDSENNVFSNIINVLETTPISGHVLQKEIYSSASRSLLHTDTSSTGSSAVSPAHSPKLSYIAAPLARLPSLSPPLGTNNSDQGVDNNSNNSNSNLVNYHDSNNNNNNNSCIKSLKFNPILSAQTPVIEIQCETVIGNRLRLDITSQNTLAIINSRYIQQYSLLEPRFRPLFLVIKERVMNLNLKDAKTGSLSSYAYVILLISYLQNIKQSILPNLQEKYAKITDVHEQAMNIIRDESDRCNGGNSNSNSNSDSNFDSYNDVNDNINDTNRILNRNTNDESYCNGSGNSNDNNNSNSNSYCSTTSVPISNYVFGHNCGFTSYLDYIQTSQQQQQRQQHPHNKDDTKDDTTKTSHNDNTSTSTSTTNPNLSSNSSHSLSILELYMGFFEYYGYFIFPLILASGGTYSVSIRNFNTEQGRRGVITGISNWRTDYCTYFNIEDPFDITHDLTRPLRFTSIISLMKLFQNEVIRMKNCLTRYKTKTINHHENDYKHDYEYRNETEFYNDLFFAISPVNEKNGKEREYKIHTQ